MYGHDMSKDPQEASAPSFPSPACGPGPVPGYEMPPSNGPVPGYAMPPSNGPVPGYAMPPSNGPVPGYSAPPPNLHPNPQNPGIYPPYNMGYVQGQSTVVTSQPTVIVAPLPLHEKDYLGYSIFNLICCCMCLGIAALFFSIKTRDANNCGDINAARANSITARNLNHVSLGIGICITIAWVAYAIYASVTAQSYYQSTWDSYYSG